MKGKGLTAYITVHEATSMYREALDGWGADHKTLNGALDRACRRIRNKSKKPSTDTLAKGTSRFLQNVEVTAFGGPRLRRGWWR